MFSKKLVGRRHRSIEHLLLTLTNCLNENNIVYHLEGGTLLGLVRDKQLLPWDHDIDISIPAEHLAKALPVLKRFFNKKWKLNYKYFDKTSEYFDSDELRLIKVKYKYLYLLSSHTYLDIFIKYTSHDSCYWKVNTNIMKVDKKYYQSYETIEYKGQSLKVPNQYESYLTEKFGDWHTVVKEWHYDNEKTIISS